MGLFASISDFTCILRGGEFRMLDMEVGGSVKTMDGPISV